MVRKTLKYLAITLLAVIFFIIAYLLASVLFSVIPVKGDKVTNGSVTVFLITNGVHSDLALPVKNDIKDWSKEIKYSHIEGKDTAFEYVAFGWGDKGFYLETPTWADLKFRTAFNAAFAFSSSAVHATYIKNIEEGERSVKLNLSPDQYRNLIGYIENTFKRDSTGNVQHIKTNANYGPTDAFYEAKGSYHLFKTCNTWTNTGLKVSGQKACLWTPMDKGMFWLYKKE